MRTRTHALAIAGGLALGPLLAQAQTKPSDERLTWGGEIERTGWNRAESARLGRHDRLHLREPAAGVSAGKEGTVYLHDARALGGFDHRTPLFSLKAGNDEMSYASTGV